MESGGATTRTFTKTPMATEAKTFMAILCASTKDAITLRIAWLIARAARVCAMVRATILPVQVAT